MDWSKLSQDELEKRERGQMAVTGWEEMVKTREEKDTFYPDGRKRFGSRTIYGKGYGPHAAKAAPEGELRDRSKTYNAAQAKEV